MSRKHINSCYLDAILYRNVKKISIMNDCFEMFRVVFISITILRRFINSNKIYYLRKPDKHVPDEILTQSWKVLFYANRGTYMSACEFKELWVPVTNAVTFMSLQYYNIKPNLYCFVNSITCPVVLVKLKICSVFTINHTV